jgi:hypothetical protein
MLLLISHLLHLIEKLFALLALEDVSLASFDAFLGELFGF